MRNHLHNKHPILDANEQNACMTSSLGKKYNNKSPDIHSFTLAPLCDLPLVLGCKVPYIHSSPVTVLGYECVSYSLNHWLPSTVFTSWLYTLTPQEMQEIMAKKENAGPFTSGTSLGPPYVTSVPFSPIPPNTPLLLLPLLSQKVTKERMKKIIKEKKEKVTEKIKTD